MSHPLYLSQAVEPFLRQIAADGQMRSSISSCRRQSHLLIEGLGDGTPQQASTVNRVKSVLEMFF